MLHNSSVLLFIIYFYALNINNAKNVYFTGNGLWWKAKKYFVLESMGNLFLNLIFGYFFGVNGIITATIITIFIFNYICRSKIMFKEYFNIKPKEYFSKQLFQTFVILISCIAAYLLASNIDINNDIVNIIVYSVIGIVIPCIAYFIFFCKSEYFIKTIKITKSFFSKKN